MNMFDSGPRVRLDNVSIGQNRFHFTEDTRKLYLDNNGERTCINEVTMSDLQSVIDSIDAIRIMRPSDVHIYGVLWNKLTSKAKRLFDSADITTDTTNFCYKGSVNENYNNPFDSIYPWSDVKQCNVDLSVYKNLTASDDLTSCVSAWYGDPDFATDGSNGFLGQYVPEFWYKGYETDEGKVCLIADKEVSGFLHHEEAICGVGFCIDDGAGGVTCNDGQPLTNIAVSTIHSRAKTSGFALMDIYEDDAVKSLYFVEYADTNSQSVLGDGCSNLYIQSSTPLTENVTGATSALVPVSMKAHCIPGATLDFGGSAGAVVLANRRTVTSVEDYDATYCRVHFTPSLDLTTSMYPSIHGKNNADSIGNKSGYIGVNGKNNAWYRGAILYGNRYQYVLGIARQTGTGHIWLCPKEVTNDYDGLNTGVFKDTGIAQLVVSSNSWQNVADVAVPEGLAFFGVISKAGSLTGDSQYCVTEATGNSVPFSGGASAHGSLCGVLYAHWGDSPSDSYWSCSGRPLLRHPRRGL